MFSRFAIYVVPDGVWGDFGAQWLGWDVRTGREVACRYLDLASYTKRPRKYGFHGTIKAPFRLADGCLESELTEAAEVLARGFSPFALSSLQLSQIGPFFALTAPNENAKMRALSDKLVSELDLFRAPISDAELQRRRQSRLSARQDASLQKWGYPHVFEDFKFHLTLTGPIKQAEDVRGDIQAALGPMLEAPLTVQDVCVVGETAEGRFHLVKRCPFGAG